MDTFVQSRKHPAHILVTVFFHPDKTFTLFELPALLVGNFLLKWKVIYLNCYKGFNQTLSMFDLGHTDHRRWLKDVSSQEGTTFIKKHHKDLLLMSNPDKYMHHPFDESFPHYACKILELWHWISCLFSFFQFHWLLVECQTCCNAVLHFCKKKNRKYLITI